MEQSRSHVKISATPNPLYAFGAGALEIGVPYSGIPGARVGRDVAFDQVKAHRQEQMKNCSTMVKCCN